ncbi:carboxylating nicotinate-nucleotide diphosphorylase [Anaerosphaera multitolerans]|uniref:Probable nicotinate-nucleotide pyrophosphorylase [carboxylating] n=1 Tax=Anaerosphaera multitolerans TaxID=2487351 RepID=A0A437S5P2_9FIRM|nr:carboxylating nicotinate-nucleotide diphosphorylase [Anaerosphaera multitolerans]RVU54314.1 carboxylating nicotinate-nucleotide diphosphorylase [Anaerosphaera multitolerans]
MPKLNNIVIDELLLQALKEDVSVEDISTNSIIKEGTIGEVTLYAKEKGVIAGLYVFERIFHLLDLKTKVEKFAVDGDEVSAGEKVAIVKGDVRILLTGERVALNYLQRMSGVATYTAEMVKALDDSKVKIVDTRKTTPNMRVFEKYATRVGGGYNHRFNLSDGVLLKDNHIAAAGSIKKAVESAREYTSFIRKIEVEVENIEMVKEALEAKADIIMLDNMGIDEVAKAVSLINKEAEIECSGNITLENIGNYRNLGLDYISTGAPTHSYKVLDLSMKNLKVLK